MFCVAVAEVAKGDQVVARPYDEETVLGEVKIMCKVEGLPSSEVFVGVKFVRKSP